MLLIVSDLANNEKVYSVESFGCIKKHTVIIITLYTIIGYIVSFTNDEQTAVELLGLKPNWFGEVIKQSLCRLITMRSMILHRIKLKEIAR